MTTKKEPTKRGQPTKYRPEYCAKVTGWGKQGKSIEWMMPTRNGYGL